MQLQRTTVSRGGRGFIGSDFWLGDFTIGSGGENDVIQTF